MVHVLQNPDVVKENVENFWGKKETIMEIIMRLHVMASVRKTGEMLEEQVRGRRGLQGEPGRGLRRRRVTIVTTGPREQGLPARRQPMAFEGPVSQRYSGDPCHKREW